MSFAEDDEILQDFLVEAGEILDKLSEQLVDLEQRPDDRDLLNAIFRGFHTVKGGAGFLQLDAMVECCHVTENLFDILRNGKRTVTSALMDVVLQALDAVNVQFHQVSAREPLERAPAELLQKLSSLVSCEDLAAPAAASAEPQVAAPSADGARDIKLSDDEFEGFLNAIGPAAGAGDADTGAVNDGPGASAKPSTDEIDEDEFQALLDQLHGPGKGPGNPESAAVAADQLGHALSPAPPLAPAAASTERMTEDEFESLLDQLHGSGRGPGQATASAAPAQVVPPAPQEHSTAAKSASTLIEEPQRSAVAARPQSKPAAGEPASPTAEATVRVDTQRLDDIMNMVGELVLVRNRLVRLGLESANEDLSKAVGNLDVVTGDLQMAVMKTRMQPIKKVFGRFPRVVRDLARQLKKEINLELVGEDTDLDKNLVEALADPLVHLVRNSVDHGIELPDVREARGKRRVGLVVLSAEQEGDHILLSITDDGAGMDPDKLRQKAVERGLFDADGATRLSDVEAFNLIFAPGFSTKAEISDVSGRGVGMDVVKTKINQLNGSVDISSKAGEGTRISIKVPLTLAIMPTLMVMLGRQSFALPLASVNEIFQMDLTRTHVVDGQECVTIRDKAIPIFHLRRWLVHQAVDRNSLRDAHVVIVSVGTRRVGFVVDQLVGQEEVVIKPLGKMLQGTPGIAGATITGDGSIALILDVPSLLKRYAGRV